MKDLFTMILQSGGFTIDADLQPIEKKDGYMVSLFGYEKTFTAEQAPDIEATIKEYQKKIADKKNLYVGAWYNEGIIYIDISKWIQKKQNAIHAGIVNNQLAVYDIKADESIDLNMESWIVYRVDARGDLLYEREFLTLADLKKEFANIKNIHAYIAADADTEAPLVYGIYKIIKDCYSIAEIKEGL